MRYLTLRLKYGDDLMRSVDAFAERNEIDAGVVVSGVGCVYEWRVRDASGVNIVSGCERAEIVSLTGTVSRNGSHIHISLAREDLSVFGGHLTEGCLINTTCELVFLVSDECVYTREPDCATGYKELVVSHK